MIHIFYLLLQFVQVVGRSMDANRCVPFLTRPPSHPDLHLHKSVFFNAITASFFFVLLCFTATSFLCRNRLYRIISALSWTLSSTNRASTSVEDEMWPHLAVGPQITFSRSLPLHWLIDWLTEWLPQLLYLLYTIKEATLNRKQCIVDV